VGLWEFRNQIPAVRQTKNPFIRVASVSFALVVCFGFFGLHNFGKPPVKTQPTALPEVLDVPTVAGVEEPEQAMWVTWFEKIKGWIGVAR
jgi:hypothetical protein